MYYLIGSNTPIKTNGPRGFQEAADRILEALFLLQTYYRNNGTLNMFFELLAIIVAFIIIAPFLLALKLIAILLGFCEYENPDDSQLGH